MFPSLGRSSLKSSVLAVLCALAVLCMLTGHSLAQGQPHVIVNGSDVYGVVRQWEGQSYHAFLGIRYGQPPLGKLRFARSDLNPLPPVVNASRRGARCHPVIPDQHADEDCLFLNVFTPANRTARDSRAVLFYIHGGGNILGNADGGDAIPLVLGGDVIVVTVHYRLGPLGFLSTMTSDAPGNMGFWDQNLALTWLSRNIVSFGGDPRRVTVMGESAGGKATSLHTVSPHSRQLFARAVMDSGSIYGPSLYPWDPLEAGRRLATRMNCPTDRMDRMVECLRQRPAGQLSTEAYVMWPDMDTRLVLDLGWGAVVDDDFLPRNVDQRDTFHGEVIVSVNNNEGSLLAGWRLDLLESVIPGAWDRLSQCDQYSRHMVNQSLFQYFRSVPPESAIEATTERYINCTDDGHIDIVGAMNLYADQQYLAPALRYLQNHIAQGPAYFYYFDHDVPEHWGDNPIFRGANHAEDRRYLMGWTGPMTLDPATAHREEALSGVMMTYLANFMKTGNPNTPSPVPVTFPPYDQEKNSTYLHMNSDLLDPTRAASLVDSEFLPGRMGLWLEELPALMAPERHDPNNNNGDKLRLGISMGLAGLVMALVSCLFAVRRDR
ncbi:cocaine esterase [Aplysia californica]|uniref:Carboxylic ester hydrolase n=1 Tax=Aplysia californica TaxID=6500 RepID=A0ABM0JPB3_APLCA|nr:cocaine esterase [Aplysia californica]